MPDESDDYGDDEFVEEETDQGSKGDATSAMANCGSTCPCEPATATKGRPFEVTARNRLSLRVQSNLDKLRATLPLAPEAIPKTHLPTWVDLPLSSKIPKVPAPPGAIIFSRGRIAKSLIRKRKSFTLRDPRHYQRIPANDYNALHDHHASGYLHKREVQKILIKQGLINAANEVICSQKEFNRFRSYLASIHNDQLDDLLNEADSRWRSERKQFHQVMKYQSMTQGKDHERMVKIQNAARKNQMKHLVKVKRYEEKSAADALRECKHNQEKERQSINRRIMSMEKQRAITEKRRKNMENELQRRKMLICQISMKDAAARERVSAEKCILKRAYQQFLLEWLDSKYQFQADQKPKREALERAIEIYQKQRALRRQDRVEKYREAMPDLIQQRKKKEAHVWEIVKRCFNKWLRKVRERKARKPDALHQSLWDAPMVLEDTLKYLRKESGYEKFDEFIMNILKLKEEIKARLAEEEAEEEKLRLEQEGEEEEGDGRPDEVEPAPTEAATAE